MIISTHNKCKWLPEEAFAKFALYNQLRARISAWHLRAFMSIETKALAIYVPQTTALVA